MRSNPSIYAFCLWGQTATNRPFSRGCTGHHEDAPKGPVGFTFALMSDCTIDALT